MISRKHFASAASHRVCSLHFVGGKETNLNNASTIVPENNKTYRRYSNKNIKQCESFRRLLSNIISPDGLTKSIETETESDLTQEAILA